MDNSSAQYYSRLVVLQHLGQIREVKVNTVMDISELYAHVKSIFNLKCPFTLGYWSINAIKHLKTNADLFQFLKQYHVGCTLDIHLLQDDHLENENPRAASTEEGLHKPKVAFNRSLKTSKWADVNRETFVREVSVHVSSGSPPESNPHLGQSNLSQGQPLPYETLMDLAAKVKNLVEMYSCNHRHNPRDNLACDLLVDQILHSTKINLNVLYNTLTRLKKQKNHSSSLSEDLI
ncbi:hypothetical protein L0F63_007120 [Massospora cicadina]|nr:hypothetical protein L0F63_007120 [Massospora cicadina]